MNAIRMAVIGARIVVVLCTAVAVFVPASATASEVIDAALVKVYTYSNRPAYHLPWAASGPSLSYGSGCIIAGQRILTNAHVVSDQTFIQVRRAANPKRYQARLIAVSHDADLAILTVDDPEFFTGVTPLAFGELPYPQEKVSVYGFPMGGDALSVTEGVISRIENNAYVHSNLALLAGQIDAAINPGNSGGPVLAGGKIVGVVMQNMPGSQNIGYMVPIPIIMHFLNDLADGHYDGFPMLGIGHQWVQNDALTGRFAIGSPQTGVRVSDIMPGSPAARALKVNDVIVSVDGYPVAGDGTIEFRPGNRTEYTYAIQSRQLGETVSLRIIRDGKTLALDLILDRTYRALALVPNREFDLRPRYCIFGGIVFMPLSWNLLESFGEQWYQTAPSSLLNLAFFNNKRSAERDEVVLICGVLAAPVNTGYDNLNMNMVETINGIRVKNFNHLVELLDHDLASDTYLEIRTDQRQLMVIDRKLAENEHARILESYGIEQDRRLRGDER